MKKHIIITIVIILAFASITAAVLLTRDTSAGTPLLTNDGQDAISAGEAAGSNNGKDTETGGQDAASADEEPTTAAGDTGGQKQIRTTELNIYSYDVDLTYMVKDYAEIHPELIYNVNEFHDPTIDDYYYTLSLINNSIQNDGPDVVDIYCVHQRFSYEFIKGEYSKHACTYKELGIDIDAALEKADIPQSIIDIGTNPDGEVIALPYSTNPIVFMFRRSIARSVWGTDDPDIIAGIIGADTNKLDKFLEAAQTLKEHGCYIVPDFEDLSEMIDTGSDALVSDKGYDINPKWQEFMDVSKNMLDKGYMKLRQRWSEEWFEAMNGKGDKPVFGTVVEYGFFPFMSSSDTLGSLESTAGDWAICVPPINMNWNEYTGILVNRDSPNKDALGPLIEWLTLDCSETGLQYELLNDTLYNNKYYGGFGLPIVSGTIYKNNDCSIDFLGGQNIYPVIYDALNAKTGRRFSNDFFGLWLDEVRAYLNGEKDRETAVADYKKTEKERISWYKKRFEDDNITFLMKGRHEQFPY